MNEMHTESEPGLSEFLVARARTSSDARLALDVAAGFTVAVAAALWRGHVWILVASVAGCFLAYGAWGIVDRELLERGSINGRGVLGLRIGRVVAAVVGAVAAVMVLISGLAVAIGPVKS
jgi:hypothetical protein